MWPNPQETADLVKFPKKSLMENFIFCAVIFLSNKWPWIERFDLSSYLKNNLIKLRFKFLQIFYMKPL